MNKKVFGLILVLIFSGATLFAMGIQEEIDQEEAIQELYTIDEVATKLGVSKDDIFVAMGDPSQENIDYEAAAEKLNVDSALFEELMNSLEPMKEIVLEPYTATINGIEFEVTQPLYGWNELPKNVEIEREPIYEFTNIDGETHYYEVIYVKSINLDWYQTAYLAEKAGGYKACITSSEENEFVFNLVNDEKYFWSFPEDGGHYGIMIGPSLGGYQPKGSIEPDGGWSWLSGEKWEYSNWAVNLDDGIIDKDPRDNTQPNDSADGQPIMGFGELNQPVSTWGDYTASPTKPNGEVRGTYAFIIEYESDPRT